MSHPLRRFLGGSNHSAVFLSEYAAENLANAAIKLVPADTMDTEAQLVQWGAAAALSHPKLLRLLDVGRCRLSGRGYLFVVMEYAEQTLAQILPRRALSCDEVTQLLIPTLDVLAARDGLAVRSPSSGFRGHSPAMPDPHRVQPPYRRRAQSPVQPATTSACDFGFNS